MNHKALASLVVALLASTTLARADVISPEESACARHAAGDACILPAGTAGRCAYRTLPQGNPATDASRTALVCVTGNDGGVADAGPAPPAPDSSGGCDVARTHGGARAGTVALGLAIALAGVGRRRRAR